MVATNTAGEAMARYLTLALFLFFVIGGGTLIGVSSPPGEWYAALQKPPFQPPNWLFAPVWTFLYILIAFAGWRTWQRRAEGPAMQIWFGQMALNFIWSPVFFVMHLTGLALAIVLLLAILVAAFIAFSWNRDRIAAILFIPYLAWVCFASLLNASVWWLN